MSHPARFLYIFQQGKEISDKILIRICSMSVSEVAHTSLLTPLTQLSVYCYKGISTIPRSPGRAGNTHPLSPE